MNCLINEFLLTLVRWITVFEMVDSLWTIKVGLCDSRGREDADTVRKTSLACYLFCPAAIMPFQHAGVPAHLFVRVLDTLTRRMGSAVRPPA